MSRQTIDGEEKVRILASRQENVIMKTSANVLRGQGDLWRPCWLLHVTYPKMAFLLPSLDLDDHQRPPNSLMMYGDKNYAGTITSVHQNSRRCIRFILGTSLSDVSSTVWRRMWRYEVELLPIKLSWLLVWGRSVFNLLWDIFTEVLMTRKGSCGLMNPHFNASPATNIGQFRAIIDTSILPETSC